MQDMRKRCSTFSRGEEVRDPLSFPLSLGLTKAEIKLSKTCARGEPVSPELILEAAVDVGIRCRQVASIAWSSLVRAKQCVCAARVCSCWRNACISQTDLWSPMVESSCNADNLDSVSIFDGELEDLVPGRRDVSSDTGKLHLSEAMVQTCSAFCIAVVSCARDTSQFYTSLRLALR